MAKKTILILTIGLFVVFGLIGMGVFLNRFLNRPIEVKISNLSPTGAVVSFTTKKPSKSCLFLFPSFKKVCQVNTAPSNIHYIELKNLSPRKKYRFLIKNDLFLFSTYWKKVYQTPQLEENLPSGQEIEPKIIQVKKRLPRLILADREFKDASPFPVLGLVLDSEQRFTEAIVYFSAPNNDLTLSALTNSKGKFALNIQPLLLTDFLNIEVEGGEKGRFKTTVKKEELTRPLKLILP